MWLIDTNAVDPMCDVNAPKALKSRNVAVTFRDAVKMRSGFSVDLVSSPKGCGCQEPVPRVLSVQAVTGADGSGGEGHSVCRCEAIALEVEVTSCVTGAWEGPVEEIVRWIMASSGAWVSVEMPVQVIRRGGIVVVVASLV